MRRLANAYNSLDPGNIPEPWRPWTPGRGAVRRGVEHARHVDAPRVVHRGHDHLGCWHAACVCRPPTVAHVDHRLGPMSRLVMLFRLRDFAVALFVVVAVMGEGGYFRGFDIVTY